jgi:hypothetical protein
MRSPWAPTPPEAHLRRVAGAASTAATGGLGGERQGQRPPAGQAIGADRLPITTLLAGERFAPASDGEGAGWSGLAGRGAPGHPAGRRARQVWRPHGGNALSSQDPCEGLRR